MRGRIAGAKLIGQCRLLPLLGSACLLAAACSPPAAGAVATGSLTRSGRDEALARARVWQAPTAPIGNANLRDNPAGDNRFSPDRPLDCRFVVQEVGGTTPKFYCQLADGETVKIKYGRGNPELYAEVAATRLLAALGFWSDRMFIVGGVRCAGCPRFPFHALRCLQATGARFACLAGATDANDIVEFAVAVVERRLSGRVLESAEDEGWGWYELDRIDPARGGSPVAEVDALRLMAVLLAHWDNKSSNQRLICPPDGEASDGSCSRPLAIMQDLGATFGPLKLDLHNWRRERIWSDRATCTVSMKHLPWGGGTFSDRRISEQGRLLLVGLLEQLSDSQLRDLFEGSRVTTHNQFAAESHDPAAWVTVFKNKVTEIRDAGPCVVQRF